MTAAMDPHALPLSVRMRYSPWAIGFLSAFVIFVDMIVYAGVIPVLPAIVLNDLHMTNQDTGILVAAYAIGLILFTPVFGYFSDRRQDRKLPIIISLVSLVATSVMFMFCTKFWHYLVARLLQGVAAAGNWTIGLALAADAFPTDQLGAVMGSVLGGMSLGYLIGPAIGGPLYDHLGGTALYLFFVIVSIIGIVARMVIDEQYAVGYKRATMQAAAAARGDTAISESTKVNVWTLLKARPVWVNALAVVVTGMLQTGVEPILPPHLTEKFNTSVTANGLVFLAISIPSLAMSPLAGYLCDRYSGKRIILLGSALTALVTPLMALMPTLLLEVVALVLFGAVFPLCATPALPEMGAWVDANYPAAAGQVYSIFCVAFALSMVIGPIAGSVVYDLAGLLPSLFIFSGALVLLMVLYTWYILAERSQQALTTAPLPRPDREQDISVTVSTTGAVGAPSSSSSLPAISDDPIVAEKASHAVLPAVPTFAEYYWRQQQKQQQAQGDAVAVNL
ncbi:major facilitator superfamily domain-containing protein [Blastocladiella britannica]|nr:major facilitator superfamily domain-containing protein [Blastocladiella britannica]